MSTREQLHSVVTTLQPVVQGVSADDLTAPTPCTDFDVRAVADHMLGTMGAMRGIGASFVKVLAQAGRDPEWSAT